MLKRSVLALVTLAAIAASAPFAPLAAQQRITGEIRGVLATPTGDLGPVELEKTALGVGLVVAYRMLPHLHLYGGWDYVRFRADDAFLGSDIDFDETGYVLGLRFEHPFIGEEGRFRYRLEGGATYKHIEAEDEDGENLGDTDHALGFEFAGGLVLPLSRGGWFLAPMLRYRSLTADFDDGFGGEEVKLRYVALELGLGRRF